MYVLTFTRTLHTDRHLPMCLSRARSLPAAGSFTLFCALARTHTMWAATSRAVTSRQFKCPQMLCCRLLAAMAVHMQLRVCYTKVKRRRHARTRTHRVMLTRISAGVCRFLVLYARDYLNRTRVCCATPPERRMCDNICCAPHTHKIKTSHRRTHVSLYHRIIVRLYLPHVTNIKNRELWFQWECVPSAHVQQLVSHGILVVFT